MPGPELAHKRVLFLVLLMRTIRVMLPSEATAMESPRMSPIAAKTAAPRENHL